MTARRSARPVTVAIDALEPRIRECLGLNLWDVLDARRPKTVRVWQRQDGITVRATGRTSDGFKISSVVKLRRQ